MSSESEPSSEGREDSTNRPEQIEIPEEIETSALPERRIQEPNLDDAKKAAEILKSVEPELIIISCGKNNPYHHPHPSILQRFQNLGIPFYRTDENGHIQITTNGKKYKTQFLPAPKMN